MTIGGMRLRKGVSSINLSKLFNTGRYLTVSDIKDSYSYLGILNKNYKIYNINSLLSSKIERGKDIPDYLFDFIAEEGEVLGIANLFNNQPLYIIFKSLVSKTFLTVGDYRQIPYGIKDFINFRFGSPIILVEGIKDRDSLSSIYPYVLSVNTAGSSVFMREVLLTFTNNFILAYDNDESGNRANNYDRKVLVNKGCKVNILRHLPKIKDCGTLTDLRVKGLSYDYEYLKEYYINNINILTK